MAVNRLGVLILQVRLAAAHAWGVAGAMAAATAAAVAARPGMVLVPLHLRPDIVGPNLTDVAEEIIAVELS